MLKSRISWLSLGDNNTKFFHRWALIKRRTNRITQIHNSEGPWIDNPSDISSEIRNNLINTFCNCPNVSSPQDHILDQLPKLTNQQHLTLSSPLQLYEIKNALWNLHPLKSPGDDGIHAMFYQKNWELINHKLFSDFKNILTHLNLPSSWCHTLICLIPKFDNPYTVNHFRPLRLCTSHYKIIIKVLINRLKPFLRNLISPHQGAFLKGRQSSDLFLLAQETLHFMNRSKNKEGWLILKLDISKAFDTLSWTFISKILQSFNFPNNWINLISSSLENMLYTPLVNGTKCPPLNLYEEFVKVTQYPLFSSSYPWSTYLHSSLTPQLMGIGNLLNLKTTI